CRSGDYIHCQNSVDVLARTDNQAGKATFMQYLVKQDWMLLPIPDDISFDHGAMACCGLGPTFGAMERMAVNAFDTVLITGLGPVGLGGVINATYRGCRVIAVEPHPMRRQLALDLGAEEVIDPSDGDPLSALLDLTDGRGLDRAVDCTGDAAAWRLAIDALRRRGQMAFVGEGGALEIKVSQDMIRKGISLHGSWHWNLNGTERMMQLIRNTGEKLDKLITHRFPMNDIQQAFELQLTGNCGKVLLDPWR
ncbi:MAG: zinc-binding dehydrogenase, partial [Candidatus Latescibacteria bacterium]|nr:zinc-binding dehydrogenase [Candidatus Latescibacterota bacterium]